MQPGEASQALLALKPVLVTAGRMNETAKSKSPFKQSGRDEASVSHGSPGHDQSPSVTDAQASATKKPPANAAARSPSKGDLLGSIGKGELTTMKTRIDARLKRMHSIVATHSYRSSVNVGPLEQASPL